MKQRRGKIKKKPKPVNEISEQDVEAFLVAVRSCSEYPRLRELPTLLPQMNLAKINAVLRFLERSGTIVVDSEGYIVWSRGESQSHLTLGEVAEMSPDAKKYFANSPE